MEYNKNGLLLCKHPRAYHCSNPRATIYKDNGLRFNGAAVRFYDLANYNYVRFFFDKEKHVLGMEPSDTALEGSIKRNKSGLYCIGGVFSYFGFDIKDYAGTYEVRKLPESTLLLIDLDDKLEKRGSGA